MAYRVAPLSLGYQVYPDFSLVLQTGLYNISQKHIYAKLNQVEVSVCMWAHDAMR